MIATRSVYEGLGTYVEWKREKEEVKKKRHGDVVKRCMEIVVKRTVKEKDEVMLATLLRGELWVCDVSLTT